MRKRVALFVLSAAVVACSGEDARPGGNGVGTGSGASAGAAGTSGLAVGGRAGQGGAAGGTTGGAAGTGVGSPAAQSTIVAGDDRSCAIVAGGSVYCWGYRADLPTDDLQPILLAPSKLPLPPMEFLVGHRHFCGLATGTHALHCWGDDPPHTDAAKESSFPAAIEVETGEAGSRVDEIAIASHATCVRVAGSVSCFGLSAMGGTGISAGKQGQTQVPGITDALSITGNASYFCARRPTPAGAGAGVRVTCWGEGLLTPTDVPGETTVESVAIAGEGHVIVRRSDGTVGAYATPSSGGVMAGFGALVAVPLPPVDAIIADHTLCAVRSSDKRIVCAGFRGHASAPVGQLVEIVGLPEGDPPVELSATGSHTNYGLDTTCARTLSGKVFCWGADRWGQSGTNGAGWELTPKVVPGVQNAVTLGAGDEGTMAVIDGGPALQWGSMRALGNQMHDGTSQLVPKAMPGATEQLVQLTIGGYDSRVYGVTKTGGLYAVQYGAPQVDLGLQGFPGALPFLPGVIALPDLDVGVAGAGAGTVLAFFVEAKDDATLGDGGLLANGGGPAKTLYSSQPIPNLVGFAHGNFHGLAWDTGGALHCWGGGGVPRCGKQPDPNKNILSPVVVPLPGEKIVTACGGWEHTCAITSTGQLRCWGGSSNGVGGKVDDEAVADDKGLSEKLTGVACSRYSTCAWSEQSVYCWGENRTGQLGVGDRLDRFTPTLVPSLPGAKHVAMGPEHTCAVKLDGTVACWGSPSGGRLGNGALGYEPKLARAVVGLP